MHTFQLGWPGDGGLGERLCRQVLAGIKTATCDLASEYTPGELQKELDQIGELHQLVDGVDRAWGVIRLLEIVPTTLRNPDPRLVAGEGNGTNVAQFQSDHLEAWGPQLAAAGWPQIADIPLVAFFFELIEGFDPGATSDGTT